MIAIVGVLDWVRIPESDTAAAFLTLAAVPLLLYWLIRARILRRSRAHSHVIAALEVAMIAGLLVVVAITQSIYIYEDGYRPYELNPLRIDLSWSAQRYDLFGNLIMLTPLGLVSSLRFRSLRRPFIAVCAGYGLATLLEIGQYVEGAGHVASVKDVFANGTGWVVGAFVASLLVRSDSVIRLLSPAAAPTARAATAAALSSAG